MVRRRCKECIPHQFVLACKWEQNGPESIPWSINWYHRGGYVFWNCPIRQQPPNLFPYHLQLESNILVDESKSSKLGDILLLRPTWLSIIPTNAALRQLSTNVAPLLIGEFSLGRLDVSGSLVMIASGDSGPESYLVIGVPGSARVATNKPGAIWPLQHSTKIWSERLLLFWVSSFASIRRLSSLSDAVALSWAARRRRTSLSSSAMYSWFWWRCLLVMFALGPTTLNYIGQANTR